MSDIKLSECLFVDLQTDEQRRDWFSLGRGVVTGIIAPALQPHLTIAYHKIVESKKLIEQLQQRITELEAQLKERDELAATVERLRETIEYCTSYLSENRLNTIGSWSKAHKELQHALESTPQQSLNAVKSEVYADGFIAGYTAGNGYPPSDWEVDQYIKSIKDGE